VDSRRPRGPIQLSSIAPLHGGAIAAIGISATAVAWGLGDLPLQFALIGAGISLLGGGALHVLDQVFAAVVGTGSFDESRSPERGDEPWAEFVSLVRQAVGSADPLLRDLTLAKTATIIDDLRRLANGRVTFPSTETWRAAYEKALSDPAVSDYRSVSWVKTEDYWQDVPGQQSMRLNYDLINRGVRIERILILGWNLWPPETRLPMNSFRRWIEDQHYRGIAISLVRETDLVNEQDLLRDFGIYGDRATGEQELDNDSRTVRFVLSFDEPSRRVARDRWDRLHLFAIPYENLLDQTHPDR